MDLDITLPQPTAVLSSTLVCSVYVAVNSCFLLLCFPPQGGVLSGETVQPDSSHLRAGRVPHVPEGEGGSAAT